MNNRTLSFPSPADSSPDDEGSSAESASSLSVVVGGSVDDHEVLLEILDRLPDGLDMALIYVPHQAIGNDGLPALLASHTPMSVIAVDQEMPIVPGHLYVPLPGTHLVATPRGLVPLLRPDRAQRMPFDAFVASLTKTRQHDTIGVVLSGDGSDGATGVGELRAAGGTVIVQRPETARHGDMPRGAIATGAVDLVLAPNEIAEELRRIERHLAVRDVGPRRSADEPSVLPEQLHRIFTMLRNASGLDFTHYKISTIRRRLRRRMALHEIGSVERYLGYMREHPDEVIKLYQDLLIPVTSFFRDPESFEALAAEVFPKIVQQRRGPGPIRIWLPGCSTGEEAYSVAIALLEFLGEEASSVPVQIFATDVSESAIEHARKGLYADGIAADLTPERLQRFFTRTDGKYRIAKFVRELIVFARQDITRDPPFSTLDLILCRNVLIYMGEALQRKLMPVFHYALKPSGFLMLGGAEDVGAQADLFTEIDKEHRIFGKRSVDTPPNHQLLPGYGAGRPPTRALRSPTEPRRVDPLDDEVDRVVLERFGPPGVIVDESFRIVKSRGDTGMYLEPAPGDAIRNLSLLRIAREGLLHGLRTALYDARQSARPARKTGLRVEFDGHDREVALHVVPLVASDAIRHYLVLFEGVPRGGGPSDAGAVDRVAASVDDERVTRLQEELATTREFLQSIIHDLEVANAELQSAGEAILSSNEELKSINEELDTAKDELQSTNEELSACNEELSWVNRDLVNLLGRVEIAIVIVGADLGIRRFTPMAETVLNLIPADIGRPIGEIKPNIDCPGLDKMIARVIDTVTIQEMNVRDSAGNRYVLRIRPYKNVEDRIDGAVLTLFDVAGLHRELC